MAKKSLFDVYVAYKLHECDVVRTDKFFAYAFSECHALQCVLRKLSDEYSFGSFYLVEHKVIHVFNFVL